MIQLRRNHPCKATEIVMRKPFKPAHILAPALALLLVAGCTEYQSPQQRSQAAAVTQPELAGAWYQVYFDTNSFDLDTRGQAIVRSVAHVVANTDNTRVTVIGRTDRVGSPATNLTLSQRRADRVRDALIMAGVPASRIDASWVGEARQAISTADDASESRNRVVDVTVVKMAR